LQEIADILSKFSPIAIAQMDEVKLLNRTDTKYILSIEQLENILPKLTKDYTCLEVENTRMSSYKTLYFDTNERMFYHHHHNGKPNRYKVRMRQYVESNLTFLEIKHKIKGRTDKSRIKIDDFSLQFNPQQQLFVEKILGNSNDLKPKLWNSFKRITLVNNTIKERLTIDVDLSFQLIEEQSETWKKSALVIAEVKQENINRQSTFMQLAKQIGARPSSISKYCLGTSVLVNSVKRNTFKPKILAINKL
jgi:hypothetical protein